MNGLIFALLIIVTIYMRSKMESLSGIADKLKKESDYYKQQEEAVKVIYKVLWILTISIGFIFWAPFVLMVSLNWLLGWTLTYWFTFALYLLWSQFLKGRRN